MYKTIVHPTDLSEASIPALQAAHELAKNLGSKLLICFVARSPMVAAGNSITDPTTNTTRDIEAELKSFQTPDPAVETELRIVIAEKSTRVKTMLKFLEEMNCDLLVLGMHRRTGVAGWLGPSITEEVVRRAGCAVLVVKHHGYNYEFEDSDDAVSVDTDSGE